MTSPQLAPAPRSAVVQSLIDIFTTQARTNEVISGADWRERAVAHLGLDYAMAAIDELVSEFVPSALGWKWWAKTFNKDLDNAKMELVDILHFIASEEMVRAGAVSDEVLERCALRIEVQKVSAENLVKDAMRIRESKDPESAAVYDMCLMKEMVRDLLLSLCRHTYDGLNWQAYFALCLLVDSSFEEQHRIYVGKAVLNRFRAQNGYKTGQYAKKWMLTGYETALEDNTVLTRWLATQEEVTEDQIFAFLTETYASRLA